MDGLDFDVCVVLTGDILKFFTGRIMVQGNNGSLKWFGEEIFGLVLVLQTLTMVPAGSGDGMTGCWGTMEVLTALRTGA